LPKLGSVSGSVWQRDDAAFPQGVASGDPLPDSVLLWTRRPPANGRAASSLVMELASDEAFCHVISHARVELSADNDWTWRVFAAGLHPSTEYWYRFTDDTGAGS